MQLHVHGSRGSSPVSGRQFERYGGHTTCFEVMLAGGQRLIIDGGTGLLRLQAMRKEAADAAPFNATLLLTHFHWDHIQGIPFFAPVYEASSTFRVLASPPVGFTVETALAGAIRPPWFPVGIDVSPAQVTFEELPSGPLHVGEVTVTAAALHHPGGVTGYRVEHEGRSVVIVTDVEYGDPAGDAALRGLAQGATVLVHDAQYTPEEWRTTRSGWGHSTWEHATALAVAAGVERLVLTSHDPDRTDDGVDAILDAARERFAATDAAFEGQIIEF